jgi:tetratricopeptide (TPR) repeat protein/transcriptional regulator with XRE-family HTH domain
MTVRRMRLAQRRKAVGLSQEALASLLHVERSTVVRWEAGGTEPMPWVRPKLARALLVSVDQLEELLADVSPATAAAGQLPQQRRGPAAVPKQEFQNATLGEPTEHVPAAPTLPETGDAGTAASVSQLPPAVADFTGRPEQIAELTQMLSRDDDHVGVPIAVISGLPGAGKTALALQVAHRIRQGFPDGQLWVALQGATEHPRDPGEVLGELVRALGVPGPAIPPSTTERAALYRSLLADRRMLVLADDAASAAQVEPLLPGTGRCAVLVTSRSEQAGPPGARLIQLDPLTQSEAVALLTRIVGDERVTAEPQAAADLAAACGQLPLAVRIAGARLAARSSWQLATLAGKISHARRRLDELQAGDLSVRASLTQSYQTLDQTARRAFRLLPLLGPGEITEWQVAALLNIPEAGVVVEKLADGSLLAATGVDAVGQPRYRCHDLLRDYAAELLADEPPQDRDAALARVTSGWLQLAARADAALPREPYSPAPASPASPPVVPDEVAKDITADAVAWFTAERLDLHLAAARCCAAGRYTEAAQLARSMASFHYLEGRFDDAERIWQMIAAAAQEAGDVAGVAEAQLRLAAIASELGQHAASRPAVLHCVAAFEQLGDRRSLAMALHWLALCEAQLEHYGDALEPSERAIRLARKINDPQSECLALRILAVAQANLSSHRKDAVGSAERAVMLVRQLGLPTVELEVLHPAAQVYNMTGRYEDALRVCQDGLKVARELGLQFVVAAWLGITGDAYQGLGRYREAAESLSAALPIFRDRFMRRHHALCLLKLGYAYQAMGDYQTAISYLTESLSILDRLKLVTYAERARQAIDACRASQHPSSEQPPSLAR